MAKPPKEDQFTDEETARRRDEALLRALSTPPKPHSAMKLGKRKPKASQRGVRRKMKNGPATEPGPKS
jgi:hypothetical protein